MVSSRPSRLRDILTVSHVKSTSKQTNIQTNWILHRKKNTIYSSGLVTHSPLTHLTLDSLVHGAPNIDVTNFLGSSGHQTLTPPKKHGCNGKIHSSETVRPSVWVSYSISMFWSVKLSKTGQMLIEMFVSRLINRAGSLTKSIFWDGNNERLITGAVFHRGWTWSS